MTGLNILFFVSITILFFGFASLKEIYEWLNRLMARQGRSGDYIKPSRKAILIMLIGGILIILGAVLYYFVCVATIDDIVRPRHPVESPIPYGIAMVVTSLVFTGGGICCISAMETDGKVTKMIMIVTIVILIVYLLLKAFRILP